MKLGPSARLINLSSTSTCKEFTLVGTFISGALLESKSDIKGGHHKLSLPMIIYNTKGDIPGWHRINNFFADPTLTR